MEALSREKFNKIFMARGSADGRIVAAARAQIPVV